MYDDLKDLYMKTVPEIFKFENKIEEFRRDIGKQSEILRRFDEIISDKASKANFRDVISQFEKKYAIIDDLNAFKVDCNGRITGNTHRLETLQEMIDLLGKNITKDIFSAVKKATSHLGKGPSLGGGGGSGVTEEIIQVADELKKLVSSKAEKQQIVDLTSQKANKIDTELAMRWIEVINR